jgi:hypothetical protein
MPVRMPVHVHPSMLDLRPHFHRQLAYVDPHPPPSLILPLAN